jgi:hypothetical protein
MTKVLCTRVAEGLRASEAIVTIQDLQGRRHDLRIERDFLSGHNGHSYLPVDIVHQDARTGALLIELPLEAETGANRLWIRPEDLLEPNEAPT